MKNRIWPAAWFSIPVLLFFNVGLLVQLNLPAGQEILYLNAWRAEPLNTIFRGMTQLGEAPVFVALGLLFMLWRYRFALLVGLAGLILVPTSYFLKEAIQKDRPATYLKNQGLEDAVETDPAVNLNRGKTSFPSGHSMAAFGMYGLMALFLDRKRAWLGLVLALAAILVAFSRIYLVQHFLADTLGGALLGLAIAGLVWQIDRRYLRQNEQLDRGLLNRIRQV